MIQCMTYHSLTSEGRAELEELMPADVRAALARWRRSAKARRVYFKNGWPLATVNLAVSRDRDAYIAAVARWEHRENNPTLF